MARLTRLEKEAVIDVINERLAGGAEDLRDAMGISLAEAEKMMTRLERAVQKLLGRSVQS